MGGKRPERVFRRLQVVGRATYSISLPKDWVLSRGLRPGDFIEISEGLDGSLRLSTPEARLKLSSCRINADLCRSNEQLQNIILAGYRIGYDLIHVSYSRALAHEISKELGGLVEKLPGFELARSRDSELVFRNVLDYSRFPVDDLIKRSYILTSEILSNISRFLETGRYDLIPYLEILRRRVEELLQLHTRLIITYFKRRELGRSLRFRSPSHIHSSAILVNLMDDLAEALLKLGELVSGLRKKIWAVSTMYNGLRRILEESSRLLDEAFNAYLSLNLEKAIAILTLPKDHLASLLREELEETSLRDRQLYKFAAQVELISLSLCSAFQKIARLALDMFMESESPICEIEG